MLKALFLLARWELQIILSLLAGLLAARFVGAITSQGVQWGYFGVSVYVPLLSVLATVFALASSLLIGHTLQFVNAAAQEKAALYHRYRDVLYRLDDFLRAQVQNDALIQAGRATSWELKQPERQDFPLRDWE